MGTILGCASPAAVRASSRKRSRSSGRVARGGGGRVSVDARGGAPAIVFCVVGLGQAFTRAGFALRHNAISQLSLGDLGWVQITSFIVTGLLAIACAVGARRALAGQPGGTWGPRLIGMFGVGL